jgi:hypothetical protein
VAGFSRKTANIEAARRKFCAGGGKTDSVSPIEES